MASRQGRNEEGNRSVMEAGPSRIAADGPRGRPDRLENGSERSRSRARGEDRSMPRGRSRSRGPPPRDEEELPEEDPEYQMRHKAMLEELYKDHALDGINFDAYDEVEVLVDGKKQPGRAIEDFEALAEELGLHLMESLRRCSYTRPTPIQKYAMPLILEGVNLMACAQTGSGKTAAFCFPVIAEMSKRMGSKKKLRDPMPVTLILAPTRELVLQIHKEARKFIGYSGLRTMAVYGGEDSKGQADALGEGCDLLVATPGRLIDLHGRGFADFNMVQFLIIDEADRMLDMGFEPQVRYFVESTEMPPIKERQTLMFSATFPEEVKELAENLLGREYTFLTVGEVGSTIDLIWQHLQLAAGDAHKDELLEESLETLDDCKTLVFVDSKFRADAVADRLRELDYSAASLHGDKRQQQRTMILDDFRKGHLRILVASNLAARGLDIPDVKLVINYDLPSNITDYIHRIGRTGRAGRTGVAVSWVTLQDAGLAAELRKVLRDAKQDVPSWLDEWAEKGTPPKEFNRRRDNFVDLWWLNRRDDEREPRDDQGGRDFSGRGPGTRSYGRNGGRSGGGWGEGRGGAGHRNNDDGPRDGYGNGRRGSRGGGRGGRFAADGGNRDRKSGGGGGRGGGGRFSGQRNGGRYDDRPYEEDRRSDYGGYNGGGNSRYGGGGGGGRRYEEGDGGNYSKGGRGSYSKGGGRRYDEGGDGSYNEGGRRGYTEGDGGHRGNFDQRDRDYDDGGGRGYGRYNGGYNDYR